jgi:hypothetical protein
MVGIHKASFTDRGIPSISHVLMNPNTYAFIGEEYLPGGEDRSKLEDGIEPTSDISFSGGIIRSNSTRSSAYYDPRAETIVSMDNPWPVVQFGTPVVQDITKPTVVYNTLNSLTKPVHSTTVAKFGLSSGKFTRDAGGLSGGYIYVTNIVKRSSYSHTAPHNTLGNGIAAGSSYSNYGMEMFFYPTSLSNNFTLLQKGPTGASANWKLGFDSSGGFLQFVWQGYGTTGGYNNSQNIVTTAGISLNAWNHVAVALVRTGTGGSSNYDLKGYFNGVRQFTTGISGSSIPENRYGSGIYIGNNHIGTESFSGYIDSLRIFDALGTGGLVTSYGFLSGNTIGVPTGAGYTTSNEICFVMNFNAPNDNDSFYCHSNDQMVGIATKVTDLQFGSGSTAPRATVGFRDIYRFQYGVSGATSYTDATGFSLSFGPIVKEHLNTAPAGTTQSFVVSDYDYTYDVYSVQDSGLTLSDMKVHYKHNLYYEQMLEGMALLEGASGNRGSSGNVFASRYGINPFRRLFGSGGQTYGTTGSNFHLFIDPYDANVMGYIMSNGYLVEQGVCRNSYTFTDALDFERTITAQEIRNLRLDILEYYARLDQARIDANVIVQAATTKSGIKGGKATKVTGNPGISRDLGEGNEPPEVAV